MQLEAGKRYVTRDGSVVYIIGYTAQGTVAIGYVVKNSVRQMGEIPYATDNVETWRAGGHYITKHAPDGMDLIAEYKPPRCGKVALWVFYSPTFGYMYRTSEPDEEALPASMLADMASNAELVVRQIVEWSEESGQTSE